MAVWSLNILYILTDRNKPYSLKNNNFERKNACGYESKTNKKESIWNPGNKKYFDIEIKTSVDKRIH